MRFALALVVVGCASQALAQHPYVAGMSSIGSLYYIPRGAYGAMAGQPPTGYVNKTTPQKQVVIRNLNGNGVGFFAVRDARSKQAFAANFNKWLAKNNMVVVDATETDDGITIIVAEKGTGELEKRSATVSEAQAIPEKKP